MPKNVEFKENEDGGAEVTMDLTEAEFDFFFRDGMQRMIDQEFGGKAKVLSASDPIAKMANPKRSVEFDEETCEEFAKLSIVQILTEYSEASKNK